MELRSVLAVTKQGHRTIHISDQVDKCPVCHCRIQPIYVSAFASTSDNKRAWLLYRCPVNECQSPFFAELEHRGEPHSSFFVPQLYAPSKPIRRKFSKHILSISKQFTEIFDQAVHAERVGLDMVCGSGYRKALEFLVKDYCIHLHPDKESEIVNAPLASCIADYITNENIKTCAGRAAWLGNDETHYEKLWDNKTIDDLKILIDLTIGFIDVEFQTKKYLEEMPSRK